MNLFRCRRKAVLDFHLYLSQAFWGFMMSRSNHRSMLVNKEPKTAPVDLPAKKK